MNQIQELASNPTYWVTTRQATEQFPFSYDQLSRLLRENKDPSLSKCQRKIGKTKYVNIKLLGLWMAGELQEAAL